MPSRTPLLMVRNVLLPVFIVMLAALAEAATVTVAPLSITTSSTGLGTVIPPVHDQVPATLHSPFVVDVQVAPNTVAGISQTSAAATHARISCTRTEAGWRDCRWGLGSKPRAPRLGV